MRDNGKIAEGDGNAASLPPVERGEVVVDGSNVAWEEQNDDGKPQFKNLENMINLLQGLGFEPIVIIDAALHHQIDDPEALEKLINKGHVLQAPAGTDADFFVLQTAHDKDVPFVSNDDERDYRDRFEQLQKRRIPFMIVKGHIELYGPYYEKALQFTGLA